MTTKTPQQLAHELLDLAITSTDKPHVFVGYSQHTTGLDVRVDAADHDYRSQHQDVPLYVTTVYLEWEYYDPAEELQRVINDVKAIVEGCIAAEDAKRD